jgi:hypothetical protein
MWRGRLLALMSGRPGGAEALREGPAHLEPQALVVAEMRVVENRRLVEFLGMPVRLVACWRRAWAPLSVNAHPQDGPRFAGDREIPAAGDRKSTGTSGDCRGGFVALVSFSGGCALATIPFSIAGMTMRKSINHYGITSQYPSGILLKLLKITAWFLRWGASGTVAGLLIVILSGFYERLLFGNIAKTFSNLTEGGRALAHVSCLSLPSGARGAV